MVGFVVRFKLISFRACLHEGGGPQIGEVTCGGSPHLSCNRDQIKMTDKKDRWVTPTKRVTSPTWGRPTQCNQAPSFHWQWRLVMALSSFLLLTILPSYFSTFLVSLHNHLYHVSIVLSPTPLPPPHLYCFPKHLYHHHICIVFPLATTTTTFVLFSHPPLQPPYLYRFPIHHYNHHICIVVQSTLTTFLLFARNRQSPVLIKYGQPLFVWLSRD